MRISSFFRFYLEGKCNDEECKNLIDQSYLKKLHIKNSFNRTFEKAPAARDFITKK